MIKYKCFLLKINNSKFIFGGIYMFFELVDEIKDLIKESIKTFYGKIKYLLVIILFIVWIIIPLFLKNNSQNFDEAQNLLFLKIKISDWFSWISLITFVYTAGWAIFQYKKNIKIKKQEKASSIAKEFSKDIVDGLSILLEAMKSTRFGLYVPQKEIATLLRDFDVNEARKLYNSDDIISEYKNFIKNNINELDNAYHLIIYSQFYPLNNKKIENYIKDIQKGELDWTEIEDVVRQSEYPFHFKSFESKILNKLEYICMDISTKAADSIYIYQSLHQMFLGGIRSLYLDIAYLNTNTTDKLYTNIIFVYNEWIKIYKRNLRIERRKNKKEASLKNSSIKHIYI